MEELDLTFRHTSTKQLELLLEEAHEELCGLRKLLLNPPFVIDTDAARVRGLEGVIQRIDAELLRRECGEAPHLAGSGHCAPVIAKSNTDGTISYTLDGEG